jgi:hypothetical protein
VLSNSQDQVQGVRRTGASVSSFSKTLALRCRRPQTFWQRLFKKSALLLSTIFAGEPQNWSMVSFDRSEQRAKAWGRSKAWMWRDCLRMWKIKASSGNDASPQQTSSILAIPFWCSYTVLKTKSRGKPSPTREDVGRLKP